MQRTPNRVSCPLRAPLPMAESTVAGVLMTGFYAPRDIARFAAWIEALTNGATRYQASEPNLARYVGEGLVLWLAFQL